MDPMKRLLLEVSYESFENGQSHSHGLACFVMTGVP
jgi:acyl transferase domain-containing protein